MKKINVYTQILGDTIRSNSEIEEVLLRALVLHTHSIALHPGVALGDVKRDFDESRVVLAPLTRTHVAQLVASLWPSDDKRGQADFWFMQYVNLTAYEDFEDVPDHLRPQALVARRAIEEHHLVGQLIPD